MLTDPWWYTVQGREAAAVICARHGAPTLPQVLYRLGVEGDPIPEMTVLREVIAAARIEDQVNAELASTITCPYCGSEPGRLCVRVRGKYARQVIGGFAERLASPFRPASFHRRRLTAALEQGLAALDDDGGLLAAALRRDGLGRRFRMLVVLGVAGVSGRVPLQSARFGI